MQKFKVRLILKTDKAKGKDDKEKAKSKCPVYLCAYINGKRTYKATGYELRQIDWDADNELVKSSNRIAGHINADLELKKNNLIKELIEKQISGKEISVAQVKQSFGNSSNNIFVFVEQFKTDVAGKRGAGTIENYTKHLKKLEEYHGSKSLTFEDITPDFLNRYENHLRKSVGNNYTHNLMKTLRTFFNAAKKRRLIDVYPFTEYEFPKYKSPVKDYLTIKELQAWEKHLPKIKDKVIYQSGLYFLLGCYAGLRLSDWFKFSQDNIDGNKIRLRATKNGADISMPISRPLARVIKLISKTPLEIEEPTINEKLKLIAKDLKIKKHLTSHSGRHSFAVTICLQNKVSSETAAELMGITLQTFVDNYSQVTDEKIDRETKEAWSMLH